MQHSAWNAAHTFLGFVNNCQCFLIFCHELEGAYRKAFLVCKSGLYCHPRWMGLGDGLKDVREKWGAGKFVSPLLTSPPLTLTFLFTFFSLSLSLASASITSRFKFPPLKSALLLSSIYRLLHVGACDLFYHIFFLSSRLSLSVYRFKQQNLSFPALALQAMCRSGHCYSPEKSLTSQNSKDFLICGLLFNFLGVGMFCC